MDLIQLNFDLIKIKQRKHSDPLVMPIRKPPELWKNGRLWSDVICN